MKTLKIMALLLVVAAMGSMTGCKNNTQPAETNDSVIALEDSTAQMYINTIGVIDFDTLPEKIQEGMRGGKGPAAVRSFNDDLTKVMKVKLAPGSTVGMHTHTDDSETIMVLEGSGMVIFDGKQMTLDEGNIHYCPKGHSHSIINDSKEDLVLCCVVAQQ
ncbi:MAG: cupin domain-containing protein [Bacteroidales bacterium]|jgi:quercetin dioxygenase-like cupin family protein|nr:cupin domain-containing protein [Bacteroidales bacterium]